MSGYETLMLHLEFEGQEVPWMYPLALNGRKLSKVVIGGEEYQAVSICTTDAIKFALEKVANENYDLKKLLCECIPFVEGFKDGHEYDDEAIDLAERIKDVIA